MCNEAHQDGRRNLWYLGGAGNGGADHPAT
jgi:hypothetical protein